MAGTGHASLSSLAALTCLLLLAHPWPPLAMSQVLGSQPGHFWCLPSSRCLSSTTTPLTHLHPIVLISPDLHAACLLCYNPMAHEWTAPTFWLGFSLQTDGMGGKEFGSSVEGRWELVQSQTTRRGTKLGRPDTLWNGGHQHGSQRIPGNPSFATTLGIPLRPKHSGLYVLVSYCCFNKLPQTLWPELTSMA